MSDDVGSLGDWLIGRYSDFQTRIRGGFEHNRTIWARQQCSRERYVDTCTGKLSSNITQNSAVRAARFHILYRTSLRSAHAQIHRFRFVPQKTAFGKPSASPPGCSHAGVPAVQFQVNSIFAPMTRHRHKRHRSHLRHVLAPRSHHLRQQALSVPTAKRWTRSCAVLRAVTLL